MMHLVEPPESKHAAEDRNRMFVLLPVAGILIGSTGYGAALLADAYPVEAAGLALTALALSLFLVIWLAVEYKPWKETR